MDCRYCHSQVERSHEAMVPPTQTCMGCHAVVHTESAKLAPVRQSWETDDAIRLGSRPPSSRPRFLQPQRAPQSRCRLRIVPRPDRPDGGRRSGRADRDAVVLGMPPQSRRTHSAQERDYKHEVGSRRGLAGPARRGRGRSQSTFALFGVPPMTRRKSYELSPGKGPSMWRSLEDKALGAEELTKLAQEEQPGGFITDLLSPKALVSRRSFVQGSSIAALAAGLQGCVRRPKNEILPYSKAPEYLVPGVPSHFATVTARGRDCTRRRRHQSRRPADQGRGQRAASRSLGATDVRGQAYVWDLYDPDRSQSPARRKGNALTNATPEDFDKALAALVKKHESDRGAGLRMLAPISNSPSFRRMREGPRAVPARHGSTRTARSNDDNAREGARIAFQVHADIAGLRL